MALTGLLALALDFLLFARLRRRGTAIIMVIASFGASLALRSLLEFLFTSEPTYFSREIQIAIPLAAGIRVTPDQLCSLGLTALLVGAMHLLLTRSHIGRAMRAVSENPALARIVGIDVAAVIRTTWLIGGALACAAGVMLGTHGADPALYGLRPAAAAVRRRHPRRHRQRARRRHRRPDRGAGGIGGRAVHRRRLPGGDRLPAAPIWSYWSGPPDSSACAHDARSPRLRRVLPGDGAQLRHHLPRPQSAVGLDRPLQRRRGRLRGGRRLRLGDPDHAGDGRAASAASSCRLRSAGSAR